MNTLKKISKLLINRTSLQTSSLNTIHHTDPPFRRGFYYGVMLKYAWQRFYGEGHLVVFKCHFRDGFRRFFELAGAIGAIGAIGAMYEKYLAFIVATMYITYCADKFGKVIRELKANKQIRRRGEIYNLFWHHIPL